MIKHLCGMRWLGFVSGTLGLIQATACWASEFDVDDSLMNWLADSPVNAKLWGEEGRRLWESGLTHSDCAVLLEGYGLILAANGHDASIDVPDWSYDGCQRSGHFISFFEGNRAFDQGDYERAVSWYHESLLAATSARQRAKVKSNLGMCYYWSGDLEPALEWMVAATEEGLEHMTPNSLNSVSSLCVSLGEFEQALEFSLLAEERLLEEFKEGMDLKTFVRYHDLFLLSRMAALLELGRAQEARKAYERANLEHFFEGLAPEFAHMAFLLAWEFNDPVLIEMHAASFGQALMADSIGAVNRLGPVLALLPPWNEAFEEGSSAVWAELRNLPLDELPELPIHQSPSQDVRIELPLRPLMMWAGVWCIAGGAGFFILRKREKRMGHPVKETKAGMMALRAGCDLHANESDKMRALAVLRVFESRWKGEVLEMDFSSLSAREVDALRAAIAGERPKDSAERWGVTARAVYAVRATLRGKLGIEKDTDLESWIKEHWTA